MNTLSSNKISMIDNLLKLDESKVFKICKIISNISKKNTVYCIGNGGSASISNHFVCDLVKGFNYKKKFNMVSLSSNIEMITAISNDISYQDIFAFQISKYAKKGDLLVAISSSGKSKNIINAINEAKKKIN